MSPRCQIQSFRIGVRHARFWFDLNFPHCVSIPPFWNENDSSVSLDHGCSLCFYCTSDPNCLNLRNDSAFKLLKVLDLLKMMGR